MNKIGSFDIVDTRTFIVPPNESIQLSLNALGWIVKLHIAFEPSAPANGIRVEPQSDHARIVFSKWDSSLGSATKAPVELGRHSNGRKLYFMATHYMIGDSPENAVVKLDLQFLMEASK